MKTKEPDYPTYTVHFTRHNGRGEVTSKSICGHKHKTLALAEKCRARLNGGDAPIKTNKKEK